MPVLCTETVYGCLYCHWTERETYCRKDGLFVIFGVYIDCSNITVEGGPKKKVWYILTAHASVCTQNLRTLYIPTSKLSILGYIIVFKLPGIAINTQ